MILSRASMPRSPGRLRSAFCQLAAALAFIAFASGSASAAMTYSFSGVSNNSVVDTATGEAQLAVTVDAAGANQVSFTFTNSGPLASSITDIYFDDGTLLGISSITDSGAGVAFTGGSASPPNLPGGATINFNTTAGFLADSNPPAQPNGVNPGEFVTIIFNLIGGQTLADTIAAIDLGLANPGVDVTGGLRIGIHVQGFTGGGSETFVNDPPGTVNDPPGTVVPEPASFATAGMGLLLGLGYAWRKRKRAVA